MVLLIAAVCTKSGKALFSRQFIDINKSRADGLLASFPKLIVPGKQHTFVESESVRYVYQPLDKLYMLLITTKASNILEDLETLRLFSKLIPEYCKSMSKSDVLDNAFSLIFAFDEIVALGYRESVNLSQIKTFTDMDSHEEKVFQALRQSQEREAHENMKRKAKELALARKEALKKGGSASLSPSVKSGSFGSATMRDVSPFGSESRNLYNGNAASAGLTKKTPFSKPASGKAMKLGGKQKDLDSFVEKLASEGQDVKLANAIDNLKITNNGTTDIDKNVIGGAPLDDISVNIEERISATLDHNGGVQSLDIHGILMLRVSDAQYGRISLQVQNPNNNTTTAQNTHDYSIINSNKTFNKKSTDKSKSLQQSSLSQRVLDSLKSLPQLQCHPNIDKKAFLHDNIICLKDASKSFPLNMDVGVVKWHLNGFDDPLSFIPLSLTCWPSESPEGFEVSFEYTLNRSDLSLEDVEFHIPVPSNTRSLTVTECSEGDYDKTHMKSGSPHPYLVWRVPFIMAPNNKTQKANDAELQPSSMVIGTLDFNIIAGSAASISSQDFFPVRASFRSHRHFTAQKGGVSEQEEENDFDNTDKNKNDDGDYLNAAQPYFDLRVTQITNLDESATDDTITQDNLPFGSTYQLISDKYELV